MNYWEIIADKLTAVGCKHLLLLVAVVPLISDGATLDVGVDQNFTTIQAAIDAAAANDTVEVHAGTYKEVLNVGKAIVIQNHRGDSPKLIGCINVSASTVTIDGLEITGWLASSGKNHTGAVFSSVASGTLSDLKITNCKIHQGLTAADLKQDPIDTGVTGINANNDAIYLRNVNKTVISKNDIFNTVTGLKIVTCGSTDGTYANGIRIANNHIHDCPNHGIDLGNNTSFVTVEDNTIYDNCSRSQSSPKLYHSDGIQCLKNGWHDLIFRRNKIRNFAIGIFAQPGTGTSSSNVRIYNNLLYETGPGILIHGISNCGFRGEGSFFPGGTAVEGGVNSGFMQIYNNTIMNCASGAIRSSSSDIKNNVMVQNRIGLSSGSGATADYNLYFRNRINTKLDRATNQGFRISPLSGQEAHSQEGDPKFVTDPTATSADPGAYIGPGSAAIARAINLSSVFTDDINQRVRGSAWDLGAYQSAASSNSPPKRTRSDKERARDQPGQ